MLSALSNNPAVAARLAAAVTVVLWTSFILIARASAARTLAPLDIALLRIVGASLVLVPIGWWLVRRRRLQGGSVSAVSSFAGISPLPWRLTALLGTFGGVLYAVFSYTGFFHAPAAHAAVLMPGSLPLWTALLAVVLLRERLTLLRACGLGLIVLGDLLAGAPGLLSGLAGSGIWKGDVLFILAGVSWATYSILAKRHAVNAVDATIAVAVFSLVLFLPAYVSLVASGSVISNLARAPWSEIVFQMAFQGGGSVVIAGIAFTRMVGYYGPVRSTMITAVVPGISSLCAVWLLAEPLHWTLVVGILAVTAGILLGVGKPGLINSRSSDAAAAR